MLAELAGEEMGFQFALPSQASSGVSHPLRLITRVSGPTTVSTAPACLSPTALGPSSSAHNQTHSLATLTCASRCRSAHGCDRCAGPREDLGILGKG